MPPRRGDSQADQPDLGGYLGSFFGSNTGTSPDPQAGRTRYNTTPNWLDPYNAPLQHDPYYQEWLGANPGFEQWGGLPRGPQLSPGDPGTVQWTPPESPPAPGPPAPAPAPGPATGAAGPSTSSSTSQFGNPSYNLLNDLALQRVNSLGQPVSFPGLDEFTSMLKANEATARERAQTFAGQLNTRIGQLQQPLMNDADVQRIRANSLNQIAGQQDAATAAARERLGARGFDPRTSGLFEGTQRSITNAGLNASGGVEANLANQQIMANEQRKNMATRLQGLAQQALQGGDVTALQNQAQVADLENQLYNLNQGRANQQLAAANIPVDLNDRGFSNALAMLGSGGGPNTALSSIFGALGLGQNQQQLDVANQASLFGGYGGIINSILNAITSNA